MAFGCRESFFRCAVGEGRGFTADKKPGLKQIAPFQTRWGVKGLCEVWLSVNKESNDLTDAPKEAQSRQYSEDQAGDQLRPSAGLRVGRLDEVRLLHMTLPSVANDPAAVEILSGKSGKGGEHHDARDAGH